MTALIWALVGYGDRGQRALGGLRARLLECRRCGGVLPAALEAVAVAVHLQDVDVVGEPVQQGSGEPLGSEDVGPLVEGEVGGDQDGAPFVALAEDLEEEFRAGGGQGHEAQLVDDEKPEAGQLPLQVEQPAEPPTWSTLPPPFTGVVLYIGQEATQALQAIMPEDTAVVDPARWVLLSASQIGRRIDAAAKAAGLGEGFTGHSGRVGMAQDLAASGWSCPS